MTEKDKEEKQDQKKPEDSDICPTSVKGEKEERKLGKRAVQC